MTASTEDLPAALVDIPTAWLSEEYVDGHRRQEKLKAGIAAMDELVSRSQSEQAEAAQRVAAGDVAAVPVLALCAGQLAAAQAARAELPGSVSTETDAGAARDALERASTALRETAAALYLDDLAFEKETADWKRYCLMRGSISDPPQGADRDRHVAATLPPIRQSVQAWTEYRRNWMSWVASNNDTTANLLRAAASHLEASKSVVESVASANSRIQAANADRSGRGLTWTPPAPPLLIGARR